MTNPSNYEEYLERYGSLTYTNVGVSMLPLLRQGKDMFILKKKENKRCQVGDVVLYRRPPSAYVLHRVIQVREQDYVILGDNCVGKEYGITDKDILGVMTGFIRNGKEHSVNEKGYRLYSFIWLHTTKIRIPLKKILVSLHRLFGRSRTKKHNRWQKNYVEQDRE